MKKKKKQNKSIILVFAITIIFGITEAIITPKMAQIENNGINTQLQSQNATTSLVVPIKASPEDSVVVKAVPIITDNPDVEFKIRAIADEMNFKWTDYLVKLANCESRLDHLAVNKYNNRPSYSYDRGLFQFNSYWQSNVSDECAFDIECSTRKTIEMINEGRQQLWACNDIILANK